MMSSSAQNFSASSSLGSESGRNFNIFNLIGERGTQGQRGPLSTYVYARDRFVDPIGGSDLNDGGVTAPFRTLSVALASVGPLNTNNRYNIHLMPGPVTEPGPILWRPWVSLFGTGKDSTIVSTPITYIATVDPDIFNPPRFDFSNVQLGGTVTLDLTASINTNIRFVESRVVDLQFTSAVPYATNPNNVFLESSQLINGTVAGALHIYDNNGEFNSLTVLDGPCPPFVEIVGGLVQGTVTLNGNAHLYSTGVQFTANVLSVPTLTDTPFWNVSADSMTRGTITGDVQIVDSDGMVAGLLYAPLPGSITGTGTVTGNFTVTKETLVIGDASAGPFTVTLPPALLYVSREVVVKKIDATGNVITVMALGGDTIDGAANYLLNVQWQLVRLQSNSNGWYVTGM